MHNLQITGSKLNVFHSIISEVVPKNHKDCILQLIVTCYVSLHYGLSYFGTLTISPKALCIFSNWLFYKETIHIYANWFM